MATGKAISDWREDKSLPKCMLYMLENEIMCDVTMVVGESKTKIKAHKYMLSSRSPVFHTMFEGSLAEKGEIIIPDIREDTFRSLIRQVDKEAYTLCFINCTKKSLIFKYILNKPRTDFKSL